jgi:NADH pyrophosphatase NudC (nudix superfamily)
MDNYKYKKVKFCPYCGSDKVKTNEDDITKCKNCSLLSKVNEMLEL